jgi:hypothetical protein
MAVPNGKDLSTNTPSFLDIAAHKNSTDVDLPTKQSVNVARKFLTQKVASKKVIAPSAPSFKDLSDGSVEVQSGIIAKFELMQASIRTQQASIEILCQQKLGLLQDFLAGKAPVKVNAQIAETVDA